MKKNDQSTTKHVTEELKSTDRMSSRGNEKFYQSERERAGMGRAFLSFEPSQVIKTELKPRLRF